MEREQRKKQEKGDVWMENKKMKEKRMSLNME